MRTSILFLAVLTHVAAAAPRKVEITAEEVKQHKLAHRVSIDLADSSLELTRFPQAGTYLTLSGPPGGPLGMSIQEHSTKHANDVAFRAWVMADQHVRDATKVVTAGGVAADARGRSHAANPPDGP